MRFTPIAVLIRDTNFHRCRSCKLHSFNITSLTINPEGISKQCNHLEIPSYVINLIT